MKIGLVLSGGAAKGAYHVGILKAFHEKNIKIDIYSGASIGALNAVIAASAPSMANAYKRLELVWQDLTVNNPLKLNEKAVLINIAKMLAVLAASYPSPIARKAGTVARILIDQCTDDEGLLDEQPILEKFHQYVDLNNKAEWSDIWVSTFEGSGYEAIAEFIKSELGINGKIATYHELKTLSDDDLFQVVMASAALPLLYQTRTIAGKTHYDGGIRDNTPVEKLIGRCDICFVSHLSNGSDFSRHEYDSSQTRIIEIRPANKFVTEKGGLASVQAMMNFSKYKVNYLVEMGYSDTLRVINKINGQVGLEHQVNLELSEIDALLNQL
ncbi:patatin-like phospholipase family protein [Aeromonas hydrophila]|uniref:patatin-like phospholipase family protein n=1 Tax=Aeromonas hydrophila TaxID=644 RepID=UPI000B2DE0C8|nr:patatin-like phospholipase family protein [Aeromonas hydrophila]QPR88248.1 patatin-like phospholipase family protein [Aeromonas hydrophila]UON53358.1 patatin-like phospholipase family protein [Aeromonas hydrophila]